MKTQFVGQPVQRKEGPDKVTGQAIYVDDMTFPGMLYGATVRSPVARGRIREIRFGNEILSFANSSSRRQTPHIGLI